jgi:hypothetical protein
MIPLQMTTLAEILGQALVIEEIKPQVSLVSPLEPKLPSLSGGYVLD